MEHNLIELLEKWYFGCTIAEKVPDVDFLLTPKKYPGPPRYPATIIKAEKQDLAPIDTLLKHYEEKDSRDENFAEETRNTDLRSIITRLLKALSTEDLARLLETRLARSGCTVKGTLARLDLLPEAFKESTKLWNEKIAFDLGTMSVLPPEIYQSIFKLLNINETRKIVTVSKSWFKELTCQEIWNENSTSSNPYLALLKKEFYAKYMARKNINYFEDVEVINGEGLLSYREGVQGLILNGNRIATAYSHENGSLSRCMDRSQILTHDQINTIVSRIETFLNEGEIELSVLTETIKPFMQCLLSGTYRVQVTRVMGEVTVFEYNSNDVLPINYNNYPVNKMIYCTQPVDLLNQQRVTEYEQLIRLGKRPALLLFSSFWSDSFLIDGHHKLKAYENLGLTGEAILIDIVPMNVPLGPDEAFDFLNNLDYDDYQ